MTSAQPSPLPRRREVRTGDQECPRCHESFTVSYWVDGTMVQARCLSCELKWPLPNVV
jgi:Zn ribbon nucleic-acid-binding protein